MARETLRIRSIVSEYFSYILVLALAGVLVGGFFTYGTYADPGTEREEFEESSWSSTAEYSHQATVQRDTDVFNEGTVLQDRPEYITSISPELNGTYEYSYQATESGELSVRIEQVRILHSVGGDGEIEYWREEQPLNVEETDAVTPNEQVTAPFSINVTEARLRMGEIEDQLGGTPGETEIRVESRIHLSGERNGAPVDETQTDELTLGGGGNIYTVETGGPTTDSGQQFGQREQTVAYGPVRSIGAPVLLGVALLVLLAVAVGRWQRLFELSEAEREWIAYQQSADEFGEWLSTGTIPDDALTGTTIQVEGLEDLVDVAIDSNRRVVRDESRSLCAVLLEETVYTFEPPKKPDSPARLLPVSTQGRKSTGENGNQPPEAVEDPDDEQSGDEQTEGQQQAIDSDGEDGHNAENGRDYVETGYEVPGDNVESDSENRDSEER